MLLAHQFILYKRDLHMGMDRKIEKKKGIKRKHIIWSLVGLVFLYLVIQAVSIGRESVYRIEKEKLTIGTAIYDDFKDYISITGEVEPITTIYLDAEEGGRVEEIVFEEGTMLKKGDVILQLSNNDLKLAILQSESDLAYSSNELRNTMIQMEQQKIQTKQEIINLDYEIIRRKRAYEQNEKLYEDKLISREEFLRSKEDYELSVKTRQLKQEKLIQDSIFRMSQREQMNENLGNMQRNLRMVRERLDNLNVKAPADGQLGYLNAEIGQNINKGERIGQVNILTNYKVNAEVDEHYIDRVKKGLSASFERQEDIFTLEVKKVYPEVRDGQFEIDMIYTSKLPENIRTGQTYHIRLELGKPVPSMMIPRGGFFQSTGGQWVYVLDPSEEFATKRNIVIGRQNPKYFEVLEGLKEGEKVIVSSYETYEKNDKIVFK